MKIKLVAKIKDVVLGYLFKDDVEITIGREIGNTIAALVDNLSRHHAKIYCKDGTWYAEDLGSTNGSYLNGVKIEQPVKINAGDMLRFGLIDISVNFVEETATATPAAVAPVAKPEPVAPVAAAPAAKPVAIPPVAPVAKPTPAPAAVSPITPAAPKPAPAPISPIAPAAAKPAPAAAPEPVKMEPVAELTPVEMEPVAELEPITPPAKPDAATKPTLPMSPVSRPAPALRPGLKLPPKPGLGATTLKPGLKLPPKPGAPMLKPGLKLPPKPGITLPPKP